VGRVVFFADVGQKGFSQGKERGKRDPETSVGRALDEETWINNISGPETGGESFAANREWLRDSQKIQNPREKRT